MKFQVKGRVSQDDVAELPTTIWIGQVTNSKCKIAFDWLKFSSALSGVDYFFKPLASVQLSAWKIFGKFTFLMHIVQFDMFLFFILHFFINIQLQHIVRAKKCVSNFSSKFPASFFSTLFWSRLQYLCPPLRIW